VRALAAIVTGWIAAPVAALAIAFVGLFFLQNVFELPVCAPVRAVAAAGAGVAGCEIPAGAAGSGGSRWS
jgi:phosphate/sulfate permease